MGDLYYDSLSKTDVAPMSCRLALRPLRGLMGHLAYELILLREHSGKVYDRRLAFLTATDARDFLRSGVSDVVEIQDATAFTRDVFPEELDNGH